MAREKIARRLLQRMAGMKGGHDGRWASHGEQLAEAWLGGRGAGRLPPASARPMGRIPPPRGGFAPPLESSMTDPMNAVKSSGSIFSTPRAAVPGQSGLDWGAKGFAAMGGGFAANMFSDPDQRGVGTFVKGAAAGFAGASLLSKGLDTGFLSQGMSKVTARSRGRALARGGESWSAGATKMAQGMESAQSRGMMFAGGAMLSGGLIGSGHSKAHGMNAQRGNRFGG